jgi:hypothetical protein
MNTDDLIARLARNATPVRPMRRPAQRTAAWTMAAFVYLGALLLLLPARGDLALRLGDPRFLIEQAAALLTGVTAALAAFASVVPGYSRAVLWAPLGFAALWLAAIVVGMGQGAEGGVPAALALRPHWACVGAVLLGAAVPAGALVAMIRRGAPVTPRLTIALAVLAAAAVGNAAMCVVHRDGSSLMILVWHCGTTLVLAAAAGLAGPQILRWPDASREVRSV